MVSTPGGLTDNSPMLSGPYVSIKQPSVRKPLHQFTETLDVEPKNDLL